MVNGVTSGSFLLLVSAPGIERLLHAFGALVLSEAAQNVYQVLAGFAIRSDGKAALESCKRLLFLSRPAQDDAIFAPAGGAVG